MGFNSLVVSLVDLCVVGFSFAFSDNPTLRHGCREDAPSLVSPPQSSFLQAATPNFSEGIVIPKQECGAQWATATKLLSEALQNCTLGFYNNMINDCPFLGYDLSLL